MDDGINLTGVPIRESWLAPRDQVFYAGDPATNRYGQPIIFAHPSMIMKIDNNGSTPFYTRHMLGTKEAARDKRKYPKLPRT